MLSIAENSNEEQVIHADIRLVPVVYQILSFCFEASKMTRFRMYCLLGLTKKSEIKQIIYKTHGNIYSWQKCKYK